MNEIGDVISIGDGSIYRLYCYDVLKYSSKWTIQVFTHHKFLWWKWSNWTILEYPLYYTIGGPTYHTVDIKRKNESNEELLWLAESELDFLGFEYK